MSELSILPRNAQPFEIAMDEGLALAVEKLETPVREAWDADAISLDVLPWLAWGVGRRTWNAAWPEAVQRRIVRDAIPTARRTGSVQSVRSVMETVGVSQSYGGELAIKEWFQTEPKGQPFTFTLDLALEPGEGPPPSRDFLEELIVEVDQAKPARSHFVLRQTLGLAAGVRVAGGARPITYTRLDLVQRPPRKTNVVMDDGTQIVAGDGAQLIVEL